MGNRSKSKKPESFRKGKVTPLQVAFIVDRYLSDNNYSQTRSVYRTEASSLISTSPVQEVPPFFFSTNWVLIFASESEYLIVLTGTEEPVESGCDVEWVHQFEGGESDDGTRKGPIGSREIPGPDSLAGYASCHEHLQHKWNPTVATKYSRQRYAIRCCRGSPTSPT